MPTQGNSGRAPSAALPRSAGVTDARWSAPETAGTEGEFFEKAIVQLLPCPSFASHATEASVDRASGATEEFGNVIVAALEKVSGGEGGIERSGQFGIHGFAR